MALVVPDVGELPLLDYLKDRLESIHLYKNDVTPTSATVLADLEECDFDGYAAQAITNWSTAYTNADGKAQTDADPNEFSRSAGSTSNDVYGYYVTYDPGSGAELLYVERFGGSPRPMDEEGDSVTVYPRFTLRSEN